MKTATERAVRLAVEGGYKSDYDVTSVKSDTIHFKEWDGDGFFRRNMPLYEALMDKDFWRCLGKRLGWQDYSKTWTKQGISAKPGWKHAWHSLIDRLADGGTCEHFFETLLGNEKNNE